MSTFVGSSVYCPHGIGWNEPCLSCGRWGQHLGAYAPLSGRHRGDEATDPDTVTLPRLDYARLMHLAYAGANLLAEPNGQTDVEPYPVNKAWLDQIDKEAGNDLRQ